MIDVGNDGDVADFVQHDLALGGGSGRCARRHAARAGVSHAIRGRAPRRAIALCRPARLAAGPQLPRREDSDAAALRPTQLPPAPLARRAAAGRSPSRVAVLHTMREAVCTRWAAVLVVADGARGAAAAPACGGGRQLLPHPSRGFRAPRACDPRCCARPAPTASARCGRRGDHQSLSAAGATLRCRERRRAMRRTRQGQSGASSAAAAARRGRQRLKLRCHARGTGAVGASPAAAAERRARAERGAFSMALGATVELLDTPRVPIFSAPSVAMVGSGLWQASRAGLVYTAYVLMRRQG